MLVTLIEVQSECGWYAPSLKNGRTTLVKTLAFDLYKDNCNNLS